VNPRLLICLIAAALAGVGAAATVVISGLGFVIALIAYSLTSSVVLVCLAIASAPREAMTRRSRTFPRAIALRPASGHQST
jgi:hypothetical protein